MPELGTPVVPDCRHGCCVSASGRKGSQRPAGVHAFPELSRLARSKRHAKAVQRNLQPIPARLEVRLLAGPAVEESHGLALDGERAQLSNLRLGKELLGDALPGEQRADFLDIYSDFPSLGDGVHREAAGVRQIESQFVAPGRRDEYGLAERSIGEPRLTGMAIQVSRKDVAKHSTRSEEPVAVAGEAKARGARPLLRTESSFQVPEDGSWQFQMRAPDV